MNLRQLEIFQMVAKRESIAQAAASLYISAPAVSKAVKQLEQSIGVTLFDRIDNRLHLNPAGQAFYLQAGQLLKQYQTLQHFGQQAARLPLVVGTSLTFGQTLLAPAVKAFAQQYPQVQLRLFAENVQQIQKRLLTGEIDLAFVEGFDHSASFEAVPLSTYDLLLVAASGFCPRPLTEAQLFAQPFLLREPGSTLRDSFDEAAHRSGYQVAPFLQSTNTQVLIAAAKAGLGIAVLPQPLAQASLNDGTLVEVGGVDLAMQTQNFALVLKSSGFTAEKQAMIRSFQQVSGEKR